jgi:hypothetical protein
MTDVENAQGRAAAGDAAADLVGSPDQVGAADVAESAEKVETAAKAAIAKRRGAKNDPEYMAAMDALQAFETARKELEDAALALDRKIEDLKQSYDRDSEPWRRTLLGVSPLAVEEGKSPPTKRAAYSDRTAALMSKFALLAYQRFEEADGRQLLAALLQAAGFELLDTYNQDSTQGFLAQNEEFAVLAFRGTTSRCFPARRTFRAIRAMSPCTEDFSARSCRSRWICGSRCMRRQVRGPSISPATPSAGRSRSSRPRCSGAPSRAPICPRSAIASRPSIPLARPASAARISKIA